MAKVKSPKFPKFVEVETVYHTGCPQDAVPPCFWFRIRLCIFRGEAKQTIATGMMTFSKATTRQICEMTPDQIAPQIRKLFAEDMYDAIMLRIQEGLDAHLRRVEKRKDFPEHLTQYDRLVRVPRSSPWRIKDLRRVLEDMWEHPPTMSLVRKDGYPTYLALQSGSEKSGVVFSVENAREVFMHWKNVGKISGEQFEDLFSRLATFEGDDPATSISGAKSIFDKIVEFMAILSRNKGAFADVLPDVLSQVLKIKHLDPRWVSCDCGYHARLFLAGIPVFGAWDHEVAFWVTGRMSDALYAFIDFLPEGRWFDDLDAQAREIFDRQDADAVPETRPSRPAEVDVRSGATRDDEELSEVADRVLAEELDGLSNPVGTPAETPASTDSADDASVDASVESESV